jgi:Xaa-Pro aminopeptidase
VAKLSKTIGSGMGLEFRESSNNISPKSNVPVRAGMVFNVSLGVSGLERSDAGAEGKPETYALLVGARGWGVPWVLWLGVIKCGHGVPRTSRRRGRCWCALAPGVS